MTTECVDVAIVGAGLSGIGAACHLRRECPGRSLAILEAREASGGTWDLFRYPGVRSDSDMHTLGYSFKPWEGARAIADGPAILSYVRDTARDFAIEPLIRYRRRVRAASWDSGAQRWTLTIRNEGSGEDETLAARFLHLCSGYYRYDRGYEPAFERRDRFRGTWVHPQHWPEDLDYAGKTVVVIGSGATAMTLVPAMAQGGAQVVMVQRSPTWVISRPARDRLANLLRRLLPKRTAYALTRWKNTRLQALLYRMTRRKPEKVRERLLRDARRELAGASDMANFTPRYDPWDQRLCLVPDSDLFRALREGGARVVTAQIESIMESGVRLEGGEVLEADIIVSATGLELEVFGGIELSVDGAAFDVPSSWAYRGMMCTGLPNLVWIFGYVNASWTLRADIVSQWFCRLLNHMAERGYGAVEAALEEDLPAMQPQLWIRDFSAGYMQRHLHRFPRQGDREPWINSQNYLRERGEFARMSFDEDALRYTPGVEGDAAPRHAA